MDQEQAWSPAEPCSYGGKSTGAWLAAEDARGQDPSDTFQSAFGNAAKIQAGAFETLSSRLDNLERTAAGGGLRDAMQGLCQGVAMLADHAARSLAQAHTQIEALGGTIDLLGGKIASLVEGAEHREARAHEQFGSLAEHLESAKARMEQIESSLLERLGSVQIQIEDIGKSLDERLDAAQARIEHLEQTALELDQRSIQSSAAIESLAGTLKSHGEQILAGHEELQHIAGRVSAAETGIALSQQREELTAHWHARLADTYFSAQNAGQSIADPVPPDA